MSVKLPQTARSHISWCRLKAGQTVLAITNFWCGTQILTNNSPQIQADQMSDLSPASKQKNNNKEYPYSRQKPHRNSWSKQCSLFLKLWPTNIVHTSDTSKPVNVNTLQHNVIIYSTVVWQDLFNLFFFNIKSWTTNALKCVDMFLFGLASLWSGTFYNGAHGHGTKGQKPSRSFLLTPSSLNCTIKAWIDWLNGMRSFTESKLFSCSRWHTVKRYDFKST